MQLSTLIILFGIFQGVLFGSALILRSHGNRSANRLFGLLQISFGLSIVHTVLVGEGYYLQIPHLLFINSAFVFLFGPLLFFYVKRLSTVRFHWKPIHLLHLAPFILYLLALSPVLLKSASEKIAIVENWAQAGWFIDRVASPLFAIHIFVYMYLTNRLLNAHMENVKGNFSSIEYISLRWIKNTIRGVVAVFLMLTVFFGLLNVGQEYFVYEYGNLLLGLSVSSFLLTSTFLSWRQPDIFVGREEPVMARRYENSQLSTERAGSISRQLIKVMEAEKPFLDSNLKIQSLAEMTGVPAWQLSQVINEQFNQNFYDFVNAYRIKTAQESLLNPRFDHYSILAIAMDCGFNSKSAFNTAFKKFSGQTPSEFRQSKAA